MANGKRTGARAILPVLFTDERISDEALLRTVRRMPRLSWVVFRHYDTDRDARTSLFAKLRRIARRRCVRIFLAGDEPWTFADMDGWHLGQHQRLHTKHQRAPTRHPPISAAVHSMAQLAAAHRKGAWVVFVSPVFATNSHKGARPIGVLAYQRMARRAQAMGMAALPLGGMTEARARMMKARGFGAIDGLVRR